MEEIFYRQICSVCLLKDKCEKLIEHKKSGEINIYYCTSYKKDPEKIIPYEKPLLTIARNIKSNFK